MRSQILIAGVGMLATLVTPQAHAAHCNQVAVFSGEGLVLDAGAVACTGQELGGPHQDTDFIVPGSSSLLVSFNDNNGDVAPLGGLEAIGVDITDCDANDSAVGDPGAVNECDLTWTSVTALGGPILAWESQIITVDRLTTIEDGQVTASVTSAIGSESRTYVTVS